MICLGRISKNYRPNKGTVSDFVSAISVLFSFSSFGTKLELLQILINYLETVIYQDWGLSEILRNLNLEFMNFCNWNIRCKTQVFVTQLKASQKQLVPIP